MNRLPNGTYKRWIEDNKSFPHDYCCLLWPFNRTTQGYAQLRIDEKNIYVHRIMCEHRNGPPPTDKHQAAHSCNRGNDGCVNPHHLSWKTQVENEKDKAPRVAARKLTLEQALQIRAAKGLEGALETAKRFNTSYSNVIAIQEGRTWVNKRDYLTDDQVRDIRNAQGSAYSIAKRLGMNYERVRRIRKREFYGHVPDLTPEGEVAA